MTPLGITITDFDGNDYREYTFERNDVFGYMWLIMRWMPLIMVMKLQERPY